MSQQIIVFDLDGTLVDTAPDLLDSLNHTLGAGGVAHTDAAGFRQFVGHGGRVMIERAYAAQQKALALDEHDRLFALFLDHYGANIPGQVAALSRRDRKRSTASPRPAICWRSAPTRPRRFRKSCSDALGMSGIIRGDLRPGHASPSASPTRAISPKRSARPAATLPGPSWSAIPRTDIDTAKAAGIPVVAVDFGYTDRHVREFEPSKVISHFDELTVALADGLIAAAAGRQRS